MANIKTLNIENWKKEVIESDLPVLVDFWAPWCGPCRIMGPVVDSVAEAYENKISVGKLNVDENRALAEHYEIMGIPSLIIFKNGNEVKRIVGTQSKAQLQRTIEQVLD
ncbi:MAG: thioredoxin [Syntrophomonadaceae bacterium]|jgi:thioredoxin 1